MKPIRNTVLTLAAISLITAPLVGCGSESPLGPSMERQAPTTNEAGLGSGLQADDGRAILTIVDPGAPDNDNLQAGASGAEYWYGSGNGKPKKQHKPKRRLH